MKHPLIFNLSLILILLAGCSKGPITEEQEPVKEPFSPVPPTTEEQKVPAKELFKAPPSPVLTTAPVKAESFSIPDVNLDMLWCKPG
ncbi:MAG: hypothetical protein OSA95_13985, partial [Opitutales bacterium]|nr:hypothetical protein [Opitutales bacterium]